MSKKFDAVILKTLQTLSEAVPNQQQQVDKDGNPVDANGNPIQQKPAAPTGTPQAAQPQATPPKQPPMPPQQANVVDPNALITWQQSLPEPELKRYQSMAPDQMKTAMISDFQKTLQTTQAGQQPAAQTSPAAPAAQTATKPTSPQQQQQQKQIKKV